MRKLIWVLLLACLPAGAQVTITGATIVAGGQGGGGGGCGSNCAYTNVANVFTLNNTFPSLTVTNGINGLPVYENTGLFNIALGVDSTNRAATGAQNFGIGDGTLAALTSGFSNVGIGVAALGAVTTGNQNACLGDGCGASMTTSIANIGMGANSLFSVTTGSYNTAQGGGSCGDLIGGSNNVCIGEGALATPTFGVYTSVNNGIYLGYKAEPSANGNTNEIVIGYQGAGHGSNTITLGNSSITAATIYGVPTFPQLGGAGAGCVAVSNTGLESVTSCGGGGGTVFQTNGATLSSSTTVNFVGAGGVVTSNPGGAGEVLITGPSAFAFSGISAATNTNALVIGTGGSLSVSGSGTIAATSATVASGLTGSPAITVSNVTDSGLTSGDCVQATTGGLLVTTGAPCGSGGGGSAFSVITSGTNSAAAMLVGTGASLGVSGSGTIIATSLASGTANTLAGFNASNVYTGFALGTGLAFSGSTINSTGITGTLSTSNCLLKQSGTSAATCGLPTENGTTLTIPEQVAVTGTVPGVIDIAAGTGNLLAAPANSYGWLAPATGGTPYDRQDPSAASSTGGLLIYGTPTSLNNRNVIQGNWFHPEFAITSGTGAWGAVAQYGVLFSGIANNNGHFTSISATTLNGGACTTPPQVAAFAGNAETAFITASTSENYQNSPVNIAVSLPYTAGQNIGLVVEVAGAGCTAALMNFVAMTAEP